MRIVLVLVLGALLAAVPVLAQEGGAMTAEQQKYMEAWMKSMTPNEHHQGLADMAGDFTMTMRMWEDPSAPPTESKGTATRRMVMGGRYLLEEVKAEMMGMPFEGMGLNTFNNITGEYEYVWLDNMSTSIAVSSGAMEGNVLTTNLSYSNPQTWKKDTARTVLKVIDKDKQVFEWHENRGGTFVKTMEIEYVRASKAATAPKASGGGW
jgi:hypothetical protein